MTDTAPTLTDMQQRLKGLRQSAKRTAKMLAQIEAFPGMYLQSNASQLMNDSLKSLFADIAQLERGILIEQSRNTTRRESSS